jgi:hypothetical protein
VNQNLVGKLVKLDSNSDSLTGVHMFIEVNICIMSFKTYHVTNFNICFTVVNVITH